MDAYIRETDVGFLDIVCLSFGFFEDNANMSHATHVQPILC